jgi:uncharacterized membrane protein YphA (DoxX/SURF4 family)
MSPSSRPEARLASLLFSPASARASRADVAVRAAVGVVFVVSGTVKFLFANQGPLRFAKIGLPAPEVLSPFVGTVEIVAGAMLAVGLLTRAAALPLAVDMLVAIATTKAPLLFGRGPEPVAAPPQTGLWAFAYQARLDVTMLLCCVYLVWEGAGRWSVDAMLARRRRGPPGAALPAPLAVAPQAPTGS